MKKMLALVALVSAASAFAAEEGDELIDTKFVCDATLLTGAKLQVTGRFAAEFPYMENAWRIEHIYVNGARQPEAESYNSKPHAAYFRGIGGEGRTATASVFAIKTLNDSTMESLVIEYLGKNNPGNYMYLYYWDSLREPDLNRNRNLARGSKVACRFELLE